MTTPATPATPATATAPSTPAAPASTSAAMAATSTPAAPAPVTTETVNPGSWMAGFNDDLKSWATNKGYKDPADLANSYRNLEKLQGVPQDRLLKLPESFYDEKTGALTAEGRTIYERLGAPKTAAEYGITAPAEGGDPKRLENFLKNAHDLGLTKAQAQKLAAADGEYTNSFITGMQEQRTAAFRDQEAALKKEWGAAYDSNKNIASDAVRRLGWDSAKIDAVSGAIGHAETMKLLSSLGKSVGEGAFINGQKPNAPLEPANAKARIAELTADRDFGTRLMNGEGEAKATWERLHREAYQGTVNL